MSLDPNPPSPAWYDASRDDFLATPSNTIADHLSGRAAAQAFETTPEQRAEWETSVTLLKRPLRGEEEDRVALVRAAVAGLPEIRDVILEFDFRRRGLRIDAVLLADGALFVVEFKRSRLVAADRDQVMGYAINLLEFHQVTRRWAENRAIVVPVLVGTSWEEAPKPLAGFAPDPWPTLVARPVACAGATGLRTAIKLALAARMGAVPCERADWLSSPFSPSSSMVDAALSLYGHHEVAAIEDHAAPRAAIDAATAEIADVIDMTLAAHEHRVVFLSGAPGAGKTLVGLDLAFNRRRGGETVFVTGNAPLVEVLQRALEDSYRRQGAGGRGWVSTGYPKIGFRSLVSAATFKIVKAHRFLGERGRAHGQTDGRVVVFDEAQRTYEEGRLVLNHRLESHEADLILLAQRKQFPDGSVVVALIGHNQAINRGERGMSAWFEAAQRQGWRVSASEETLALLPDPEPWRPVVEPLRHGHLSQSMRFYRNDAVERWAGAVLDGDVGTAAALAGRLADAGLPILLTRDLGAARRWARRTATAGQRCGLIASGQARRLAAHGLFVDHKPDIATWMLAPSADHRSSNALEAVQNQYQVQGLELDYTVVCWDLDLRREGKGWAAYRMVGAGWQRDKLVEIARNSYRVLLTRARKGMVVFVPPGDAEGDDETRPVEAYDRIARHLEAAGARALGEP